MRCIPIRILLTAALLLSLVVVPAHAATTATAGEAGADPLMIVTNGRTNATVVVAPDAGPHTKDAAADLVKHIELMTGARPALANTADAIRAALAGNAPVLLVGEEALKARPALRGMLNRALKKDPMLRVDGIVVERHGNRVYLAGANDESHYYAVSELLHRWGCRWYVPTDFGAAIPEHASLAVGDLSYAYGSPFEIRTYWIAWVGDNAGRVEFQRRNMMHSSRGIFPATGHALGAYTRDAPGSKSAFNFPITSPVTARHVADKVNDMFARGDNFSLGMEDGSYDSDYEGDVDLMKLQWDKYFMRWSVTDPMLELYNNVARILQQRHPNSTAKIGFLAYANMTIPPVRDMKAERSLYTELAPIDIDPIHGMDHPDSPPRQEYRDIMYAWAKVMDGRMAIYDYDQGMLVWRDFPNPSHMAFRQDVKHYRDAGILGINTESRNAIGTVFLNLFFRGQLMWNPDADVDALLEEFYPKFYGPAAEPMRTYWTAIYDAWENTIVTEHEHFVAPAIYTPEVMKVLARTIVEAERAVAPLKNKANRTRNEQLYLDRMVFTRKSYDILNGYMSMVNAAATELDYATAVRHGERALAVREQLTDMSGIFTTYRGYGAENGGSPAWWPGEVAQYRRLLAFTNGEKGRLVQKLPVEWAFHRDDIDENLPMPEWHDKRATVGSGLQKGYHTQPVDLTYWNANKDKYDVHTRKDYPTDQWEMIRTDLYAQAQGVRHPDRQSYIGVLWYRTDVELTAQQASQNVHIRFPGIFNETWLYVNGKQVAHRPQNVMWWYNDYAFEWDVNLKEHLKPGKNTIAVRCYNPHHFGGMFRRPFLYEPVAE